MRQRQALSLHAGSREASSREATLQVASEGIPELASGPSTCRDEACLRLAPLWGRGGRAPTRPACVVLHEKC